MNTSSITESAVAQAIKTDVRALADETLKAAREHVVDPAVDAARRASHFTRDAVNESRERLSRQAHQAEHYLTDQYDRTTRWITANPVTSVGIALAAGLFLSALLSQSAKR